LPDDEQLYEGKTIRDIVIGLDRDVKHIRRSLQGNGHAGLITRVDHVEDAVTKHKVYFALLGASLFFVGTCVINLMGW